MNGVPDDAIRLRLFEFSLKGEAKMWIQSFPLGYFTTWDALVNTFLAQYFPMRTWLRSRTKKSFKNLSLEDL